jgi:hypothetical protein
VLNNWKRRSVACVQRTLNFYVVFYGIILSNPLASLAIT